MITLKQLINKILLKITPHIPLKKNRIVFNNFFGDGFGDNPKYIALELIKRGGYDLYWITKDENIALPKGIKPLKTGSFKERYYLNTCKMRVSNIRNYFPVLLRKKQLYLQTWHGNLGFKKVEMDAKDTLSEHYIKQAKYDGKNCTGIISANSFASAYYTKYFWLDKNCEILEFGQPRNDALFQTNSETNKRVSHIKSKLNIAEGTYVVLYAPTFRDIGTVPEIDLAILKEVFEAKFNKKCKIIVRFHSNSSIEIKRMKYNDYVLNGNSGLDATEACLISDFLITDYSSIFSDFIILKRPFILYMPDVNEYSKQRGLGKLYNYFNSLKCFNFEELCKKIKQYDNKVVTEIKNIKFYDDGHASERTADWIETKLKR